MDGDPIAERNPLADASHDLATRQVEEQREARELAQRYGLELVDMAHFRIDNDLFRTIPFDLMLRYNFIPERQLEGRLAIVMADPKDVTKLDELE